MLDGGGGGGPSACASDARVAGGVWVEEVDVMDKANQSKVGQQPEATGEGKTRKQKKEIN